MYQTNNIKSQLIMKSKMFNTDIDNNNYSMPHGN